MSPKVVLQEPPSLARPLDQGEAEWQTWVAKGRAKDLRGSAAREKAVKWVSIVALLVTAGFWPQVAPYELGVRFLVAAGAIAVMFEAFQTRRYAFSAVFGILALLYNPVVPVYSLSGDWQRTLVAASCLPFVASLAWRKAKPVTQ